MERELENTLKTAGEAWTGVLKRSLGVGLGVMGLGAVGVGAVEAWGCEICLAIGMLFFFLS